MEDTIYTAPDVVHFSQLGASSVGFFSSIEQFYILVIFGFALLISILVGFLLWRKSIESKHAVQVISLVILVASLLFTITADLSADKTTPVLALLGTLSGYVFGKNYK